MRLSVSVIIVAVLAATTTTAATAAQAAPAAPAFPERLDLPTQGLESRVEFWKKVYTQYGEDDVIIHDRIRVNIIYDVATRDDQTEKIAAVRQVLDEIRDNVHTQVGIKERFRQGIIRSGRYVHAFQEIFEKQGIPAEIALLPLVESSFENR